MVRNALALALVTWYGQAPGIFRDWAGLFVKIADAPAGSTVEPDSFFALKPW